MDHEGWSRLLARMPEIVQADGSPLAVAFIGVEDFAAKQGQVWLWWPGSRARAAGPVAFDGSYSADWGLLLVMNDMAIAKVGAEGTASMSRLVRGLDIRPYVLHQRDELDASGVLEFIDTLELATPKH